MLKKDFKVFNRFFSMWISKHVYNRKFVAVPWRNGCTHWHFTCTFCDFICHYDTFDSNEAKQLKMEMFTHAKI